MTIPLDTPGRSNQSVFTEMTEIRSFCNADLPGLLDVWIRHWSAVGHPPAVSVPMIEQSVLSRTFFDASTLKVAYGENGQVEAWAHFLPDRDQAADEQVNSLDGDGRENQDRTAILAAICFDTAGGLAACDRLLSEVESAARDAGFTRLEIGPLRDKVCGYAGLSPIGHGIGVPNYDARTTSLLSRRGYEPRETVISYCVTTNTYRPPVGRESLQLRRSTRIECFDIYPRTARQASAMAHLNLERHQLIEHRTGTVLAEIGLWTSDPEAQVMDCAKAILDLCSPIRSSEDKATETDLAAEAYLIGSVMQGLPNRRIFEVETSV